MAKNSVFGRPLQKASLSKHGFNMSQNFKFTSSCGHLLPVYFDFLNPGESIKISYDLFTRTQPLHTAAMVDIDEYVETFFVPLQKICNQAPNYLMGINDPISNQQVNGGDHLPFIQWSDLDSSDFQEISPYGNRFDYFDFGTLRLFEMLNIPPDWYASIYGTLTANVEDYKPNLSPLYLCAYQAIYQDYYRLSSWENCDVQSYNVDSYMVNNASIAYDCHRIFQLRYRPYQRDYFKSIENSPLLNSIGIWQANVQGNNLFKVNQWLGSVKPVGLNSSKATSTSDVASLISDDYVSTVVTNTSSENKYVVLSNNDSAFSFSSPTVIRTLFAVDKLLRVTGLAGKHYDDQVLAHFGFNVPKEYSREVRFLGQHHQVIHVGEVISTAQTEQAALGKIAGKGYAKGSSKDIRFTAPCHGILMSIYSCTPRLDYVGGIDKLHSSIYRQDFYIPELDNLGMQPLFMYEAMANSNGATGRLGWQYRFMQYKTKYDRATRAFASDNYDQNVDPGSFRHWAIAFHANLGYSVSTLDQLLCHPTDLNPIMLVGYAVNVKSQDYLENGSIIYSNDPLLHSLNISCFKTSTMSTYGLEKDL